VTQPFSGSVLEATLKRITFANPETGYTVTRVDAGRGGDLGHGGGVIGGGAAG
jgi:exodeoxyribonuclease V alpha subunit